MTQQWTLTRSNSDGHSESADCVSFTDDAEVYRLHSTNIQRLLLRLEEILLLSEHPESACIQPKHLRIYDHDLFVS